MNKGTDLIQRQQIEVIDGYPTGNVYIGLTLEELAELEKELKALEIIKAKGCSYMEIALIVSCDNYEEYCIEMDSGRVYSSGYECERALKTQEEFNLLKEVLL